MLVKFKQQPSVDFSPLPEHDDESSKPPWLLRGPIKKKNVPKSGKGPKGGGVSSEDKTVHNSKYGLFDKRGRGRLYFHFFPRCKCRL